MKPGLLFFLLLCRGDLLAQNKAPIDSLAAEMCKTISSSTEKIDSVRIFTAYEKHLGSFIDSLEEKVKKQFLQQLFYRLQKNCDSFWNILQRNSPQNANRQSVTTKPTATIAKTSCPEFRSHTKFFYIEPEGDTILLVIEKGYWTDMFQDGSYSKLTIHWVTDCEFDIVFVESNNENRKYFSQPGDKYRYELLEKTDRYFLLSAKTPGKERYSIFKLYY
jgi:hypothetical protein